VSSINVGKGLIRLWVFLTTCWEIGWWSFVSWEIYKTADFELDMSAIAIIGSGTILPPLASFGLVYGAVWVARGFKP
jgi:hypothetical protein